MSERWQSYRPTAYQDFALGAILDELRQLNARLTFGALARDPAAAAPAEMEVSGINGATPSGTAARIDIAKEPTESPQSSNVEPAGGSREPSSELPAGFPGRARLAAAGITSTADVPRTVKQLKSIRGIGPALAAGILKALAHPEELNGL